MTDVIIIGVVVVILILAIRPTLKHFKGEGGCCGGGSSVKPKKKHLKNVVAECTMTIEGMSCEHCKNRVEQRLNELEGVAASVNLRKRTARIRMEKPVSDEVLLQTVEKAGYQGKIRK